MIDGIRPLPVASNHVENHVELLYPGMLGAICRQLMPPVGGPGSCNRRLTLGCHLQYRHLCHVDGYVHACALRCKLRHAKQQVSGYQINMLTGHFLSGGFAWHI